MPENTVRTFLLATQSQVNFVKFSRFLVVFIENN